MTVQMTVRRNRRPLFVLAMLLLVILALYHARGGLFPYIFALVLAYLLLPAVNLFDRIIARRAGRRLPRALSIVLVYLLTILLVGLFVQMLAPLVAQQFGSLWENREALIGQTEELAAAGLGWYRANLPEQLQAQIDASFAQAGAAIAGAVQNGAMRTLGIVTNTVSFLLGMIVIPFWLFYVLADQPRAMLAIRRRLPDSVAPDVLNIFRIIDAIMGAYIRGQLILCLVIGVAAGMGLTLLGVPFAAVLGVFAGMLEFIPFLGPIWERSRRSS